MSFLFGSAQLHDGFVLDGRTQHDGFFGAFDEPSCSFLLLSNAFRYLFI